MTRCVTGMTPIDERVTKPSDVTGHTRLKNAPTGMPLRRSTAG